MNMLEKFLFDTSFEPEDLGEQMAPDGAKPAAPKFGEEDLEKARAEGFAAGKETGERDAMQAIEQQISQALSAIGERLSGLSKAQAEANEHQARDAIEVALAVVRKMLPRMAGRHGLAEIESVVSDCLARLRAEPRIVIRVADSLLDEVEQRVSALAARAGFEGKTVYLSQEGLQPGDIRVEWADGGAERDSDRLWSEIDQLIAPLIGPTEQPAEAAGPSSGPSPTNVAAPEPAPAGPVADPAVATA